MTLSELILQLEAIADEAGDHDPQVMIAYQPIWPLQASAGSVVYPDPEQSFFEEYGHASELSSDPEDHERWTEEHELAKAKTRKVYIGEGGNGGYLDEGASTELGWR